MSDTSTKGSPADPTPGGSTPGVMAQSDADRSQPVPERDTGTAKAVAADRPSKASAMRELFIHLGAQVYPDGPHQDYADLVDAAFPPDRSATDQAEADRRDAGKRVKAAQEAMAKAQADVNAAAQAQVEAEAKATAEKDKEAARAQ